MLKRVFVLIIALLFSVTAFSQILWDVDNLAKIKGKRSNAMYKSAIADLCAQAEVMLSQEPYSVMQKASAPVSGDMHDYMSLARYFWPNPDTPDGLPYVNRDGISNPEIEKYDRYSLGHMCDMVSTLALAWYMTGDERYSDKAVEQIRVWFFDHNTRMNPHLKYAQVCRGQNGDQGRSYGLLDSYSFINMLDGVCLLEKSPSFTEEDSDRLKSWFKDFLEWFLTSKQGEDEFNADNNHSVAYDVQVVAIAKYIGDVDLAECFVKAFPQRRIFAQVEPDGSQPKELSRTLAFGYSQYNISHMIDIMIMGKNMGFDISSEVSQDGRSLFKAIDFLTPYVGKSVESWPYQQISEWDEKVDKFLLDINRVAKYLAPQRKDYKKLYKRYYLMDEQNIFNPYVYREGLNSTSSSK